MKVIRMNMKDGIYDIPLELVARHRADHFLEAGGTREQWQRDINESLEAKDDTLILWLVKNIKEDFISKYLIKYSDEISYYSCRPMSEYGLSRDYGIELSKRFKIIDVDYNVSIEGKSLWRLKVNSVSWLS